MLDLFSQEYQFHNSSEPYASSYEFTEFLISQSSLMIALVIL